MFEAVGENYWSTYFSTLRDRLKTGGTAGLQIITVADRFFEDYRRNIDFIRRFIFPRRHAALTRQACGTG